MVAVDRPISIPGTRSLVRTQADGAAARIAALMTAQPGTVGVRLGMANDWGSATGFSYTLSFVSEGDEDASDELIELSVGGEHVSVTLVGRQVDGEGHKFLAYDRLGAVNDQLIDERNTVGVGESSLRLVLETQMV